MGRSGNVESVRPLWFRDLLRYEVREEGPMSMGEHLSVNHIAMSRTPESGNRTSQLTQALEVVLICSCSTATVRMRERIDVLEHRIVGGVSTPSRASHWRHNLRTPVGLPVAQIGPSVRRRIAVIAVQGLY